MKLLPPSAIGAPDKFDRWRRGQEDALTKALNSQKKFVVLNLPTGSGKSLLSTCYHLITGMRAVYLTESRGLQDQMREDFGSISTDVRGMGNYACVETGESSCEGAPCTDPPIVNGKRWYCGYRDLGCLFYDQYRLAKDANLAVTNYAFWLSRSVAGKDVLGQRQLMILDEAHSIPDLLSGHLRIELQEREIQLPRIAEGDGWTMPDWRDWAVNAHRAQEQRLAQAKDGRSRIRDLVDRLAKLAGADDSWVPERTRYGWAFEPLWPGSAAHRLLYDHCGAEKILLVSATITPKTLQYLGLGKGDYDYITMPSYFPLQNRMVTHIPTARVTYRAKDSDLTVWVSRMDQILSKRLDRKGIIHTVSYARARDVYDRSEYKSIMLVHDSRNTREVVEQFKNATAPCVMVSPAISTGFDFPMELCRYQIIAKLPFPDTRGAIMGARAEDDPEYPAYLAMTDLLQMTGRAVRSGEDWSECFVVDDSIRWALVKYRDFMPKYWLEAYRSTAVIPPPPKIS